MTWSDLLVGLIAAIVRAFGETYLARARDGQAAADARARGRAEGATETATTIGEIADAQARAAADAAVDADALARRMHQRAAASRHH